MLKDEQKFARLGLRKEVEERLHMEKGLTVRALPGQREVEAGGWLEG